MRPVIFFNQSVDPLIEINDIVFAVVGATAGMKLLHLRKIGLRRMACMTVRIGGCVVTAMERRLMRRRIMRAVRGIMRHDSGLVMLPGRMVDASRMLS